MTNEQKALSIANLKKISESDTYKNPFKVVIYERCLNMAEWKDKQIKQMLVDFMQYLNKRDFFHDDLCFDIEHQVETFIELQNRNKTK